MIQIVPFEPEHADAMDVQIAQRMTPEERQQAMGESFGDAWTAMVDGEPVACAGLVPVWFGRAYAWALLSERAGAHMVAITRAVRRALDMGEFRRVEMAVRAGFAEGERWARLLGFSRETPEPMRAYLPNGQDAYLYAKVSK